MTDQNNLFTNHLLLMLVLIEYCRNSGTPQHAIDSRVSYENCNIEHPFLQTKSSYSVFITCQPKQTLFYLALMVTTGKNHWYSFF